MNITTYPLTTEGILFNKFSNAEMLPIRQEIDKIKNNFDEYERANDSLAGHIEREYRFNSNIKDYLQSLILPLVEEYNNLWPEYLKKYAILTKGLPFDLSGAWVNFQKKYEFNPMHNHSGLFSFVIWVSIPYLIEDEENVPWKQNSEAVGPGYFQIFFSDTMGGLRGELIPADKKYENSMILFPSSLHHCVYPFYTSDDYRISVSGNLFLKV